ncbi:hypothetical protein Agabi119p4_3278 [Agaricus bisporus var. burnettii]|uniref:Thiolase N-terminal domain-containing protein n=1 Tax=Agaricus bisporus var. burnettii TaxID=192524 RepID=A0A8H7F6T2_AGABI|nr:hypothetical protein Agabi119p4_3278 [Agaricus bisporus var. burnettii]
MDADYGFRDGVAAASLSKLKPSFTKDRCTHAGNASQVSDGAAVVLLTRRSVAQKLDLPIVGKCVNSAVVGIMGVGPAFAIQKSSISQAVFSVQHVSIPVEKVNINGGAIAMGPSPVTPLAASALVRS